MAGGPSSTPSAFSRFCAISLPASTTIGVASISCTRCSYSLSKSAAEAPPCGHHRGGRHLLPWPGRHGASWAEVGGSASSKDTPGASPPLHRRRRGLSRSEQGAPASSSVFLATKDHGDKFDKIQGVSAELMTHMNSICGLWRDSWKIQGSRGKSVFLVVLFLQISWLNFGNA